MHWKTGRDAHCCQHGEDLVHELHDDRNGPKVSYECEGRVKEQGP